MGGQTQPGEADGCQARHRRARRAPRGSGRAREAVEAMAGAARLEETRKGHGKLDRLEEALLVVFQRLNEMVVGVDKQKQKWLP